MRTPAKLITAGWFLVSSLLFSIHAVGYPSYTIKVDIKGLRHQTVLVSYWRQLTYQTDTLLVKEGPFMFVMLPTDGSIATLETGDNRKITFWLDGPSILITGGVTPTTPLTCTGTPENNTMEQYRRLIEHPFAVRKQGKSSAQADLIVLEEYRQIRRFISQHSTTTTAAYLLYWQAMYDTTIFDSLDKLLANLSSSVRNSYWAHKAISRIYNVRHKPRIGHQLPSFRIPTATGAVLSLDSLKGKYVLLDFWGTWCIPCLEGISELKALEAKYRNRLTVVSIALERPTDRAKWLRIISKYGMSWPQGIELGSRQDGVNGLYSIWEYPTLLLADPKGIYLAKLIYGQPLEERIRQFIQP